MTRPSDDFAIRYSRWLSNMPTKVATIETLEFKHASMAPMYFANWGTNVDVTLEDETGNPVVTCLASRFSYNPGEINSSTDQSTNLAVSSYDGTVYDMLRSMTMAQREDPILVKVRLYHSVDLATQLVNPAPVWTVHSATAGIDAVNFELRADPLRVRRTGRYYTALEFPILRLLR